MKSHIQPVNYFLVLYAFPFLEVFYYHLRDMFLDAIVVHGEPLG